MSQPIVALVSHTARERLAGVLTCLARALAKKSRADSSSRLQTEELAGAANVTAFTASRLLSGWQSNGAILKRRARFCFALRNVFCSTRSDPTISLSLTFAPLSPLVLEQVQGSPEQRSAISNMLILPLEAWIESAQGRPCLNERTGETRMALVRLLVVDDFRLWQECVQAHLEGHPEVQIVGFASNGLEALQKVEDLQPDLVSWISAFRS